MPMTTTVKAVAPALQGKERKCHVADTIRRRETKVNNLRAFRGFTESAASQTDSDASVSVKQETVSLKSLWGPIQAMKRQWRQAVREGRWTGAPPPILSMDTGTEFGTVRNYYRNTHDSVRLGREYILNWFFQGPVRAAGPALSVPANSTLFPVADAFPLSLDRMTYIRGKGTDAIARTIPTNPVVDLSTTIGELRKEGLPKLVGLAALRQGDKPLKALGDEYLNVEFGWKPIIRDIKSLSQSILQGEKIIKQLERDSGRVVRRKYRFPTSTSTVEEFMGTTQAVGAFPSTALFYNDVSRITGPLTRIKTTTEEIWFSGAYSYYFDRGSTLSEEARYQAAKAKKLLGLKLDASTAWNLTGWTWLFDWFGNTGSVLHNLGAFASDHLVLRYGYVMCKTTVEHTYRHTSPEFGTIETTYGSISKVRLRATPYGFGSDLTQLNARQSAILVALGLSAQKVK